MLWLKGMSLPSAAYQIDSTWQIIQADFEFCRLLGCAESSLIGRDVRTLLREDWEIDFRTYVARALVGVGVLDTTVPMVAQSGEVIWFKHSLEPVMKDGRLHGYRATIAPHQARATVPAKGWWDWRPAPPKMVWNFESHQPESFAKAS
jgi:PAS domain S-box-containing protein